jgi:hypothetical protein
MLLRERIRKDPLGEHLFEAIIYRERIPDVAEEDAPLRRFKSKYFLEGFDDKLEELIDHIEDCISKHGASSVLVEYPDSVIRDDI